MKDKLIEKIIEGDNLEGILLEVSRTLFERGPVDGAYLEMLSYFKLYQPDYFAEHEEDLLEIMGLFFKNPKPSSLRAVVFEILAEAIQDEYDCVLTPVQTDILNQFESHQFFSFSAPTSTGKSFVFRELIRRSERDVVVIVPSRALINEYLERICSCVDRKTVAVLPFVDKINTDNTTRNIFVLTPERARELFRNVRWLDIEFVLFDEAQLSDEKSTRGLYFDGIVRRVQRAFPKAKLVFAHPFVSNPEAQLQKNHLSDHASYEAYSQRTVGQMYYAFNEKNEIYYHFGSNKELLGSRKIEANHDPVEDVIKGGGSVFIYASKESIVSGRILRTFSRYIELCAPVVFPDALRIIDLLSECMGGTTSKDSYYYSNVLAYLKRGIVIHHGSVPLSARKYLERFVQEGYCRICFATSTLEQGINMPFDLVFLWRFEASKPLAVKNLIGRAGRSTNRGAFDFGRVVVKQGNMSGLRRILNESTSISNVSNLDEDNAELDVKYQELKDSINSNTYSDEYNLTPNDLRALCRDDAVEQVHALVDLFDRQRLFEDESTSTRLVRLYSCYLGRSLSPGEKSVLETGIRILIMRWKGMRFQDICRYRFSRIARVKERRILQKSGEDQKAQTLPARFEKGYDDIPNEKLSNYPLFAEGTYAANVDYDRVVFDTYDYLDRLIGFKLSDVYYAAFSQYSKEHNSESAGKIALLFKYGTTDPDEIMMLRYGFDFDDFEWLKPCVEAISERCIEFNSCVEQLSAEQQDKLAPYLP